MAREAMAAANSASAAAPASAKRVAVRPTNAEIPARTSASGIGARSAAAIVLDIRLMANGSRFGWKREKAAGTRPVRTPRIATRARHLLLERRHAGDVVQNPEHEERRQQRGKTPWVAGCYRHHRIREPAEPLEEIIRVP